MDTVYTGKIITLRVKQVTAVLLLSLALQFTVHLFPFYQGLPWGARLLAMFYAPLIAVRFFGLQTGIISALFSPYMNWLFCGQPREALVPALTMELAAFAAAAYFLGKKSRNPLFTALLPYLACVLISALLLHFIPGLYPGLNVREFFINAFVPSVPGLLALFVLDLVILKYRRK
ncbi:MAG: hypothetical protein PHN57_08975 [Candidatus Omnitrophica bacterium]|nr:hypothetical protein [Candidatus Omnitrophota bacterium]